MCGLGVVSQMCDVEWALTVTRGELCRLQFYNVFKSHPDQLRWDDSNGVGVFVEPSTLWQRFSLW